MEPCLAETLDLQPGLYPHGPPYILSLSASQGLIIPHVCSIGILGIHKGIGSSKFCEHQKLRSKLSKLCRHQNPSPLYKNGIEPSALCIHSSSSVDIDGRL